MRLPKDIEQIFVSFTYTLGGMMNGKVTPAILRNPKSLFVFGCHISHINRQLNHYPFEVTWFNNRLPKLYGKIYAELHEIDNSEAVMNFRILQEVVLQANREDRAFFNLTTYEKNNLLMVIPPQCNVFIRGGWHKRGTTNMFNNIGVEI